LVNLLSFRCVRLERRSIKLKQLTRKTAAQAIDFRPVFYPTLRQQGRKPVQVSGDHPIGDILLTADDPSDGRATAPWPTACQEDLFMELSAMLVFATAVIAMQAAPGPVVAVALSRAMNRDTGGCVAFGTGVCIGQLIPIVTIALGFGAWAQINDQFLAGFRLLGAAYMLWLSWQMWHAGQSGTKAAPSSRGLMASAGAGIAICLGSPYTIVFYLLMLPSVAPSGLTDFPTIIAISLIAMAMTAGTLAAMMMLAAQVGYVLTSPRLSKIFNRAVATLLAGTSVLLVSA